MITQELIKALRGKAESDSYYYMPQQILLLLDALDRCQEIMGEARSQAICSSTAWFLGRAMKEVFGQEESGG